MIWFALLWACSPDDVAARQDAAAQAASDALGVSLVLAELAAHTRDEPVGLRHAGTCGCPCTEKLGTDDSYVQELDYQQPTCVPVSGLLPAEIGGHVWLDVDEGFLGIGRAQAWLGHDALDTDLEGHWDGGPGAWSAELSGDLSVGDVAARVDDLELTLSASLVVDGGVDVGSAYGTLEGVVLPPRPASDPCPLPLDGRFVTDDATVTWEGDLLRVEVDDEVAELEACDLAATFLAL